MLPRLVCLPAMSSVVSFGARKLICEGFLLRKLSSLFV